MILFAYIDMAINSRKHGGSFWIDNRGNRSYE